MCGDRVVWVPGTDHAGIATQAVVERHLLRTAKTSAASLGREPFVAEIWKWREMYGGRIEDQLRRMGASLDWSRNCFTMDSLRSKVSQRIFFFFSDYIRLSSCDSVHARPCVNSNFDCIPLKKIFLCVIATR